jgi:cell wall-associated NlpC family hydrolase
MSSTHRAPKTSHTAGLTRLLRPASAGQRRVSRKSLTRAGRTAAAVAVTATTLVGATVIATGQASAATSSPASTAISYALNQLGDPYVWGANGPGSFDCSGLTSAAYASAGVYIPRTSREQYQNLPKVSRSNLQPGDLIFFAYNRSDSSSIHHVAIYLSPGWMLEAPYTGSHVRIVANNRSDQMSYGTRPSSRSGLLTISRGEVGDNVRDMQKRLRANGYSVSTDGEYGTTTYNAVRSFQVSHGLSGSGTVGSGTWAALVANGRHNSVS